jgi:8-oxo-dGTP pyrophosphatase MutT (NUDIX family)
MENVIAVLREAMNSELPGIQAHLEMSPLRRPHGDFPERAAAKQSAVAVILTTHQNNPVIILTKRNTYNGAHSGQVSFPGGRKDTSDVDLEFTARRESEEEIGLTLQTSQLVGALTEVYIPVSKFLVQPYVYTLSELPTLKPDVREVNEIFFIPLESLKSPTIISTMDVKAGDGIIYKNIPCFRHEEHQIWGATALILNELRHLLNR